MARPGRAADVMTAVPDLYSTDPISLVERLSALSVRGLGRMYDPRSRSFPHRVRARGGNVQPVSQGLNVRYTSIAALGLTRVDRSTRRSVLAGQDLADLLPGMLGLALAGRDPGALALAVWASAEIAHVDPAAVRSEGDRVGRALERLMAHVRAAAPVPTAEHAWTLVALLAAGRSDALSDLAGGGDQLAIAAQRAADRLRVSQSAAGLFPHHLPATELNRLRFHVACFTDQIHSVQALTRYGTVTGDAGSLAAAARCADRVVALQGSQGQWWWHYDWRLGTVVERYPVFSVHQYALAPMALLELWEAGGPDHRAAVADGLAWLLARPETSSDLVLDDLGVVWRTVGRREPGKLVRSLRSAASSARPGLRLGWLDPFFPAGPVNRECRPFEPGWMLYAWQRDETAPLDSVPAVLAIPGGVSGGPAQP
jgi:hypothetical protein